jgi:hypothetical protein
MGVDPARRPVIDAVTPVLRIGEPLTVEGRSFALVPGGSGGNGGQDSSTNHPVVQLASLQSGQVRTLWPDPDRPFTDRLFVSLPITSFTPGTARVTVIVAGVASEAVLTIVRSAEGPSPTAGPTEHVTPSPTPALTVTPGASVTPGPQPVRIYMPHARRRY